MTVAPRWTLVVLAVLLAGCANPFASESAGPRALIDGLLEAEPTTPVVVPTRLPDGYLFLGSVGSQSDGDGLVVKASWLYTPAEGPGDLPVVELCVTRAGIDPAEVCVPDNHEAIGTHEVDGLTVTIVPVGPGPDEAAIPHWRDVELTTDWRNATWLRD
jgi:hypothetical protein